MVFTAHGNPFGRSIFDFGFLGPFLTTVFLISFLNILLFFEAFGSIPFGKPSKSGFFM